MSESAETRSEPASASPPSAPNVLREMGGPLFYKIANPAAIGLAPPAPRLGEAVRLAVRSLSVMQKEAVVVSSRTGTAWRLASDEGAYLAGHDEGPCPLSFLSTGMVSSYVEELRALAAARGVDLGDFELVQDNYYTMKGSAIAGTMLGGALPIDLELRTDSDADQSALSALLLDAVAASPLNGLMRGEKDSLFTLTHNGRAIETADAKPALGAAPSAPSAVFERIAPSPGDWSGLIHRTGEMTPPNENTRTFAGGSLTDHQDRMLHVRVACRLRPDGVKEITQYLYNPHGTVFRYLSDESPEAGGGGRAPDAASYVAAGIGFCFMTQFGRYAKIVRKDLRSYQIVQDLHLSLGGATSGSGLAGAADPIETHVFLETGEDDAFARTALDMAERTCFLHAFCRTDLKARVKTTRREAAA